MTAEFVGDEPGNRSGEPGDVIGFAGEEEVLLVEQKFDTQHDIVGAPLVRGMVVVGGGDMEAGGKL